MTKMKILLSAIGMALIANPAQAAYIVDFVETGGDVVATGSGTLNVSGLNLRTTFNLPRYMTPGGNNYLSGGVGGYKVFQTATPPSPFGTGGTVFIASSVGSPVGVQGSYILVPQNYVSGSDLGTTVTTFANASFSSLGLAVGSYVWTWGSGMNADSFTINVREAQAAVPEPASWAMMILGFGLAGSTLRRRAQQKAQPRYDFA